MPHTDFSSMLAPAAALIREGGKLILQREQKDFQVEVKSAKNFVTEIDVAVEKLIVERLRSWTPDYPVITEETKSDPPDPDRPTWILDPVDGTTNLMRGFKLSAISLALAAAGSPVAGLVFNPYTDELFMACAGKGATLNGSPVHTSRRAALDDCMVGFGTSPYDRSRAHDTFAAVEKIFLRSLEIRRCGSAALDIVYVACGRLDAFFERSLQPWDYAAGSLILQEAGGHITNWQGEPPSLLQGGSILASNGLIHNDISEIINGRS